MIFVNKVDIAHTRSITDARSIDTTVITDGFAGRTKLAKQTQFTTKFNLVVGNVANIRICFTDQAQTMS